MSIIYTSGTFTSAVAVGKPRFENPIPDDNTPYILRQDYIVANASWATTALNTAHPDFATFLLCHESTREDIGGGLVRWTRTYAKVPATWSDPSSLAYQFIGFYGVWGVNVVTVTGRPRFTKTVAARIQFDYYLLDGSTYVDVTDLPVEQEQKYLVGTSDSLTSEFLADAPPFTVATNPTRSAYEAMVTAGDEIVAVASTFRRWMGNIIERQTTYIVAQ